MSQQAGAPLGPYGRLGVCLSKGQAFPGAPQPASPAPSCCTAQRAGGRPGCLSQQLLQKREKPRASPALSWLGADLPASAPSIFPKRGTLAWLWLRLGKGDSAGTGGGEGLPSDLWQAQGCKPRLSLRQGCHIPQEPETPPTLGWEVSRVPGECGIPA